jgi:hypothetical protein
VGVLLRHGLPCCLCLMESLCLTGLGRRNKSKQQKSLAVLEATVTEAAVGMTAARAAAGSAASLAIRVAVKLTTLAATTELVGMQLTVTAARVETM